MDLSTTHPLPSKFVPDVPPSEQLRVAPFFRPFEMIMDAFVHCTGGNDDPSEIVMFGPFGNVSLMK